jgi:putative ABC transport system permease protein
MILRQGLTPAWIGVAVGLLLSMAATRLLPRLFPLQHGYDARSYALVIPLLLVVALMAAFVPARRAARVNAIAALRCD